MRYFVFAFGLLGAGVGASMLWRGYNPASTWGVIAGSTAFIAIAGWDIVQPVIRRVRHSVWVYSENQQRTLVVYSDIAFFVVYALGCGGMALTGLLMALSEKNVCGGYFAASFFGPGALLFAWYAVDPRPRLVIDHDGVFDRMLGVGLISWEDIEDASLMSICEIDFVRLVLRDPAKYGRRMSWLRRKLTNTNPDLGCRELNLNLMGITITPEEVLQLVRWHLLRSQIADDD
jgi:hypothetical protein